jgi:putative hydrolase
VSGPVSEMHYHHGSRGRRLINRQACIEEHLKNSAGALASRPELKIVADLHTHSVASGHAYSTVNELVQAAAGKGLLGLAITDHGPALPGGPPRSHFGSLRHIPPSITGVRVFRGVEANILNCQGELDLDQIVLGELEFVMAGLHEGCGFCGRGVDENTRAVLAAMENPQVHGISHPGNPVFPLHHGEIVLGALRTGTALEINNSSLSVSRQGSRGNCRDIARLCAQTGTRIMVGSDAHFSQGVGVFDAALSLIAEAGVPGGQVVNASWEGLLAFLGLEG